jgi:hypothetical protein
LFFSSIFTYQLSLKAAWDSGFETVQRELARRA